MRASPNLQALWRGATSSRRAQLSGVLSEATESPEFREKLVALVKRYGIKNVVIDVSVSGDEVFFYPNVQQFLGKTKTLAAQQKASAKSRGRYPKDLIVYVLETYFENCNRVKNRSDSVIARELHNHAEWQGVIDSGERGVNQTKNILNKVRRYCAGDKSVLLEYKGAAAIREDKPIYEQPDYNDDKDEYEPF